VIAAVRPKQAINAFFRTFRMALSICETTWVLPLMSRRDIWHPHAMGQIMLLSRVTSHDLSLVSVPLVDRLALFWGGCRLDLRCEVPGSCETVVSIVLIGPVGSPPPFPRPSSSLSGCGEALLSHPESGEALHSLPKSGEAPLSPVE